MRTDGFELAGWEKILPPISRYRLRGKTQFELAVARSFDSRDPRTTIRGNWNLHEVQVHDQQSRRRIEDASAEMVFDGDEARVTDASFRLGSTPMKLQGVLRNFSDPVFQYVLRSPKVRLADLHEVAGQPADAMTAFHATGEIRAGSGTPSIRNALFVSAGSWQGLPYRNLNAEVVWSATSITLKKLSLEALGGDFAASGSFGISDSNRLPLDVGLRVRNLDLNRLPVSGYFNSSYSLEGRLSIDAQFHGNGSSWNELGRSLTGKGSAQLSSGVLRNFNLAGAVLSDVNGLPGVVNLVADGNAAENEAILAKRDTFFDSLEASFSVEKGRLSTQDLVWRTDDYTALGEGWIDLDRSTRWNATLVMAPGFSQLVAQEHRNIRFLLDRNGRLVVPFRVEGTVRRPQIKPDVKRLAEVIQRGLLGRDSAPRRSAVPKPQQQKKRK
ncbi:MAG: AsmA-like C-terminal region-containing protein, partial [Candidatus Binatia bacterium]